MLNSWLPQVFKQSGSAALRIGIILKPLSRHAVNWSPLRGRRSHSSCRIGSVELSYLPACVPLQWHAFASGFYSVLTQAKYSSSPKLFENTFHKCLIHFCKWETWVFWQCRAHSPNTFIGSWSNLPRPQWALEASFKVHLFPSWSCVFHWLARKNSQALRSFQPLGCRLTCPKGWLCSSRYISNVKPWPH